jgi:hypothetical protein
MKQPGVRVSNIRRSLIKAIITGGVVAVATVSMRSNQRAFALERMTKPDVDYQDQPKGLQMCSTCTLFEPPAACKIVEGTVSPNGWCKDYAMAD